MKTTKLLIVKKQLQYSLFTLLLILVISCKEKENKILETQNKARINEIAKATENQLSYTNNLEIISGDSQITDHSILLKIPVPNKNFKHLETRDVSSDKISAIVYVITDMTTNSVLKLPIKHFYKDTLDIKVLKSGKAINDELVVFIVNDHPADFNRERTTIFDNFKKQIANGDRTVDCEELSFLRDKTIDDIIKPKEACGGIIVR